MKTISQKLLALRAADTVRNFSISLIAIAVVALTLYILINSPA